MIKSIITKGSIAGEPLNINEVVYFVEIPNTLVCYSLKDEKYIWKKQIIDDFVLGANMPKLSIFNEKQLLLIGKNGIYLIARESGKTEWEKNGGTIHHQFYSNTEKIKGIYFEGMFDYFIAEIDIASKKLTKCDVNYQGLDFQALDDNTFIGWEKSNIYSFNYTGEKKWELNIGKLGRHEDIVHGTKEGEIIGNPVLYNKMAIFNVIGYHLIAINHQTGEIVWVLKNKNLNSVDNISIKDETLYIIGFDSCLEVDINNGNVIRETDTKKYFSKNKILLPLKHFIIGNYIFLLISYPNYQLAILDKMSYKLKQTIDLNGTIWPVNFNYSDGFLSVRNFEGELQIFEVDVNN